MYLFSKVDECQVASQQLRWFWLFHTYINTESSIWLRHESVTQCKPRQSLTCRVILGHHPALPSLHFLFPYFLFLVVTFMGEPDIADALKCGRQGRVKTWDTLINRNPMILEENEISEKAKRLYKYVFICV